MKFDLDLSMFFIIYIYISKRPFVSHDFTQVDKRKPVLHSAVQIPHLARPFVSHDFTCSLVFFVAP